MYISRPRSGLLVFEQADGRTRPTGQPVPAAGPDRLSDPTSTVGQQQHIRDEA